MCRKARDAPSFRRSRPADARQLALSNDISRRRDSERGQTKGIDLLDAEFDSPTAGEGAETIPLLAKDDGAENRDFPG